MISKTHKSSESDQWSSGRIFVLAAGGAAIGLSNIWQFPYLVSEYGGGLFIILYTLSLLALGLPLVMAQTLIGRLGRASPIRGVRALAQQTESDWLWGILGWLYTLTGFLVLAYLSVIGGAWTLAYTVRAMVGAFSGLTADGIGAIFTRFVQDPEKQIFWHSLFIVMTMIVVARGLRSGLQPFFKVMVPLLFMILGLLLTYATASEAFERAIREVFIVDLDKFSIEAVLVALGHAFLGLGLGFGVYVMYGAYLPEKVSIARVSLWVIILELGVALMAAVFVFTILYSANESIVSGPLLLFQSIPLAFDILPLGMFMGSLFFLVLVIIVWMTAVGLVEPVMAWMVERGRITRSRAAVITGLLIWVMGVVIILSFSYWKFSFDFFKVEKTLGVLDALKILNTNILIPVVAIVTALFAGWVLDRVLTREGLGLRFAMTYRLWLLMMRIIIPLLLLVVIYVIFQFFL